MYLLFVGNTYNALGGARDFEGAYETLRGAQEALFLSVDWVWNWAHIAVFEDSAFRIVVLYQCEDLRPAAEQWDDWDRSLGISDALVQKMAHKLKKMADAKAARKAMEANREATA